MDNNEYKLRIEQLAKMLEDEKYSVAAKLADSLDWRRVNNIKNLNMIAKAYRMVKDYEQELEVLQLAYEHSTTGRAILENLIKCAINLEDLNLSIDYYNRYVKRFPSANTYYLKFLLYRLQGASPQELIAILKEHYNGADEKAMFDLAVLYYREGMINQCINTCDDIIMFCHPCDESYKAMELKMKFMPLNEVQMEKYHQKHKNNGTSVPISKEVELKDGDLIGDIVIPEYSLSEEKADKLQEDLSMSVQSLMKENSFDGTRESRDTVHNENDFQIPGQMGLEDFLVDFQNKKEEAFHMIASYQNPKTVQDKEQNEDNSPYLSPEALMKARTKELSVDKIVKDPKIQKTELIPPVGMGEAESLDLIKDIMQDLSLIRGRTDEDQNEDLPYNQETEMVKEKDSETKSLETDEDETIQESLLSLTESEAKEPGLNSDMGETEVFIHREKVEDIGGLKEDEKEEDEILKEAQVDSEVPDYYNPKDIDEDKAEEERTVQEAHFEEFQLTQRHKEILGYFANIPDFNRALSKAIHYLVSQKRYMAISSISQDNRVNLSKRLIEAAYRDIGNKNVKLAISNGGVLNEKDINGVFEKIEGGFLVIDEVADLTIPTVEKIYANLLLRPQIGLVVCDVEKELKSFFDLNRELAELINIRVRLPILTNDELINFGKEYAGERGYVLDDMAVLAIYDAIGRFRQSEKVVTVSEIKEIIDKGIDKKESKAFGFFGKNKKTNNVLQEKDLLIKF